MFSLYFGKYAGEPIYSVPDDYLSQMLSFRGLTPDVKEAVIRELKHRELWGVLQDAGEPFQMLAWKPKAINSKRDSEVPELHLNVGTRKAQKSQ